MSKSINQQEILAVASFFEEAMFPWHLKLNHIEDLLLLLNCIMESSLLFNMMIETKQNNEQQIHGKCLLLLHGTSGKQKNSFIFENKQLNLPSWKCQFLEYATLQAHRFKKKKTPFVLLLHLELNCFANSLGCNIDLPFTFRPSLAIILASFVQLFFLYLH